MLLLLFLFLSIAFGQDCPKNWGGLTEWAYADGGNVTLTSNTILRKDVDVQFLEIPAGMKLVIDDLAKIVIRARNIYVWGEFHIGSETCAHQGNVEIVFTGPYLATTGNEGIKGMTVYGTGIVNMFGAPAMPTWTFLTKNGEINDTSITLEDSVGWKVGDKIVIASSDFDQTQAEMLTVTRVQGNVVSFAEKLNWLHWGAELKYVDERAEVGRLTRNIKLYGEVVQGDPSPKGQWFGGHTLFQTGAKVKISHVEFTKMGQGGELARYPVHFHIGRDGTGNYVKGSSFHNNFQRCITVHWTDNLIIKDNVAYNATGHCYFLEEGNEVGNTFEHNLGVVTFNVGDPLRRIIPSDETQSAMFWITNTNNTYIKNAAAGGAFGYWYALPENPIGMAGDSGAYAKSLFGRYLGLGIFDQNRGHSATSSGLFIDQGPAPDGQTRDLVSYSPRNYSIDPDFAATLTGAELENLINNRPPQYMTFSNFIGHHNRENGVWGRGDSMILKGARLSNNKRGATFPGGPNFLYDTIFVGDSANIGSVPDNQKATAQGRSRPYWWDPATQICGYQHYDCCGPNFVINALFFNYTDTKFVFTSSRRRTGAITFLNGQHPIPPNTRFFNIKFENVQNRLLVLDDPNQRTAFKHASLVDADGSITGKCGSIIVPNQPIFIREGCKVMPDWNMAYCPPNTAIPRYTTSVALTTNPNVYPYFYESLAGAATYGDDYYDNSTNYPANQYGVGRLTVYRLDDGKSIWAAGYQDSDYPTQPGKVTYSMNYMQNLLSNTEYFYQFPVAEGTPARLRIGLYQTPVNEWIRAAVAYPVGTTFPAWGPNNYAAISSCNNIQYTSNCPMTAVATKNDLKRNTYYWDSAAGILWLHIQPATQQYSYRHGFVWENSQGEVYITAACPNNQCNVSSATAFYNLDKNGAVFSKKAPYNAAQTIMCNKNGYGDLGKVEYKSIDVENVIIGDAVQKPWQIPTWSYKNLTWSNAAVQLNVSAYGYLYVSVNDYPSNYSFNLSMLNGTGPFAFQFDIKFEQPSPLLASRTQQMKGEIPLTLSVQDKYSSTRYDAVVNSPFTVPNPPIGTTWQTATVPFKMFNNGGLPTNINISAFFIQVSSGFNTIFYADNVKIISYSESWTSVTPPTYLALTTAKTDDPLNLSPILAPVDPCAGTGLGGSNGGSSGGGGGASGKDAGLIVLAILLVAAIAVAIFFWHKFRMASSVSSHMTT